MSKWLASLTIIMLLACCGEKDVVKEAEQRAGQTAKAYYELLLADKYEDFVSGSFGADSLPADYREQLVANAQMLMAQQKKDHEGIDSIGISRCVADTATHTANAFLTISYKDKTRETIVVQMVEKNDVWYMK